MGRASEIYAIVYFGVIIVVSLLECVVPRRSAAGTLRRRWIGNFGLSILDTVFIRTLFPVVGVGWALVCAERGWGLFNNVSVSPWVTFPVTVGVLDLAAFLQHNALHRVPVLWRFHRAHHTDHEMDFSTGARFHPFEALFTTIVLMAAIAALGAPPVAVLVSQLLTTALTFLEHGNLRVPDRIHRTLRLAVVTPDMHRIHHSQDVVEGNSNFGTIFPWWDRLFGTYLDRATADEAAFKFGLEEFGEPKHQTLPWMLAQPFLRVDPASTRLRQRQPDELRRRSARADRY